MSDMCPLNVGSGSTQYRCRLAPGHDGPCVAPEVGRSTIERERWEREQRVTPEPPSEQAPEVVVQASVNEAVKAVAAAPSQPNTAAPVVGTIELGGASDFESAARSLMSREEMTPALQNWLTGTAAQIALNHLWQQASAAFDAGCDSITLTRLDLERFIPEKLRPTA